MTLETHRDAVEPEQADNPEGSVVRRDGVFRSVLRGLLWPFGVVVRVYRGFWWVLGFRQPQEKSFVNPAVPSPARQSLAGRKRLHRVTRLLLAILPRRVQGALGYPVSSSIGRSLSPEIRVSPTKPCGKGSKRKQDELDEDEEEEESQTWVEALTQELAEDEGPEMDPDYEPSTIETESEEYRSHNNTESDIEVQEKGVVIEDVNTEFEVSNPSEVTCPAVVY
ncbi:oogenesis-related isoform X1 [Epinephelus fuscoguttatus]|uniref:oogenesis-related isoform X1 n=1 Tax=Epinephelus fuscoguttatus TaxID=293821 RepID=UPI0020D01678|nr:oogenesis-related isoform X1 [Epinephelus fuscoguttatus]